MTISDGFTEFVLGQLEEFGDVVPRRMFGGVGLYHDGLFFALLHRDILYFKVSGATRARYTERGMPAFQPFEDRPAMGGYHEVPESVLEDPEELAAWAREAHDVAKSARRARPRRRRGSA